MSLHIDVKFVSLISGRFERIVRKNDYLWNCRCILCGDSKKNKSKMRGYIYRKQDRLNYICHNCGASTSIGNIIQRLDENLYKEYIMERYSSGAGGKHTNIKKPKFIIPPPKFDKISTDITYQNAERCDKLPSNHFCIEYLKNRHIDKKHFSKFYYTDNYKKFCDEIYPSHGKNITDDKRLVIPFYDEFNSLIAVSGRALENASEKLRYVTIRTNESTDKLLYGLNTVNKYKTVYIVEGPIDSIFIENAIASGDSNLSLAAKTLIAKGFSKENLVLCSDNENRNKEICKMTESSIKLGYKVLIWPDTVIGKDINEMIQLGMSEDEIENIISNNTFKEIQALTKYTFWKRT
jgi:hypothetical protein